MTIRKLTKDYLYKNLYHDWDGEINNLHGENLYDTPNSNSRHIREMVVDECLRISKSIKALSFWRRLFNLF